MMNKEENNSITKQKVIYMNGKERENKDTDMIWFVVCEKCGQVDSAPNGSFMEAGAKLHAKNCGNNVVMGSKYKPTGEPVVRSEWVMGKEKVDKKYI